MPAPAISPATALAHCETALAAVELDALTPAVASSVHQAIEALARLDLADAALASARAQPTISVDQAADVLGVNRVTIYGSIKAGDVPSIRLGRRVRIPSAFVLRQLGIEA